MGGRFAGESVGESLRQRFPVVGVDEAEKCFGTDRVAVIREPQVCEPASVDGPQVAVRVEGSRKDFRLRQRRVEDELPGYFLLGVPEQEHDPAQLPVPVVLADEAAFDVEFQLVPAEPDVRPRRQIAAVPVLLQPLENSGQKVFLVLADGEQVGNPQRMGKIPPPRRSTLYACMLISVNSPSGVSSMQATETRLIVSHTAGTCIPAGLLRWKRRNFILSELRT